MEIIDFILNFVRMLVEVIFGFLSSAIYKKL